MSRSPSRRTIDHEYAALAGNCMRWGFTAMTDPLRSLDARYYTDPAIFAIEKQHLLASTWQFAGHVSQLEKSGDFFTFFFDSVESCSLSLASSRCDGFGGAGGGLRARQRERAPARLRQSQARALARRGSAAQARRDAGSDEPGGAHMVCHLDQVVAGRDAPRDGF